LWFEEIRNKDLLHSSNEGIDQRYSVEDNSSIVCMQFVQFGYD